MVVSAQGKEARTRYEVATSPGARVCSLLECTLETGRTPGPGSLASLGHPVVGDRDYGGARDGLEAPRMVLHAGHLALSHPVTAEPLAFTSPLPDDLAHVSSRRSARQHERASDDVCASPPAVGVHSRSISQAVQRKWTHR